MTFSICRRLTPVPLYIAVALAAPGAYAQQDDSDGRVLDEITVTATKTRHHRPGHGFVDYCTERRCSGS